MTREDLTRCEAALEPLTVLEGASPVAVENASTYNTEASDARAAVLDPVRALLEKGAVIPELTACLQKFAAELAFWRRVLVSMHPGAFRTSMAPSECVVRYLLT